MTTNDLTCNVSAITTAQLDDVVGGQQVPPLYGWNGRTYKAWLQCADGPDIASGSPYISDEVKRALGGEAAVTGPTAQDYTGPGADLGSLNRCAAIIAGPK